MVWYSLCILKILLLQICIIFLPGSATCQQHLLVVHVNVAHVTNYCSVVKNQAFRLKYISSTVICFVYLQKILVQQTPDHAT